MTYPVRITSAAWRDLEEIYDWIAEHDSPEKAEHVLGELSQLAESIADLPQRGSRPRELPITETREFRQVFFKPYRAIYEARPDVVVVHLIVDGRRNLASLLRRRLGRKKASPAD